MSPFTQLLRPAEAALNRGIEASSTARTALARVAGRKLVVEMLDTRLSVTVTGAENQLLLHGEGSEEADARIKGTLFSLFSMILGHEGEQRVGHVTIEGDAEVAQQFRDLLKLAVPDLEEELARRLGDVPAHHIGRATRTAFDWGRKAIATFGENMAEFLQEENRTVVPKVELEEFAGEVDKLREALDRLEARVQKLGPSPQPSPASAGEGVEPSPRPSPAKAGEGVEPSPRPSPAKAGEGVDAVPSPPPRGRGLG
jgi:ubiquinone biosynthesis protein UbiJ